MSLWYGRDGKVLVDAELGTKEWEKQMSKIEKLLTDPAYKIVQQDYTPKKKYWVSTVWLGLDHSFMGKGKPIIFETMVFSGRTSKKKPDKFFPAGFTYRRDFEQVRYSTEAEAIKGHKKLLKEYTEKEGK